MLMSETHCEAQATELSALDQWLGTLPCSGQYPCISEPRRFKHDETQYDAQYGNQPVNLTSGHGVVNYVSEHGIDTNGPVIEIGCGTGRLSLGLVHQRAFPEVLLTDPSPVFLNITAEKLRTAKIRTDRVRYGLLMGEDVDRLPKDMFSMIVLRSTLHHILDIDRFIQCSARALRPGGALVFQEPCMEGYVQMGAMAQFLPALCEGAQVPLSDEQRKHVDMFQHTMQFYARRDMDKSKAEDKHLFRVDELMATAREAGLTLHFKPNTTFDHLAAKPSKRRAPDRFKKFFHEYLKYCMSWDEPLMELFNSHLAPYCDWLDGLCETGSPPYLHGVFLAQRV